MKTTHTICGTNLFWNVHFAEPKAYTDVLNLNVLYILTYTLKFYYKNHVQENFYKFSYLYKN